MLIWAGPAQLYMGAMRLEITDENHIAEHWTHFENDKAAPGADFVHKNNGTPDDLRATIQAEIDRIRGLHKEGTLPEAVSHTWWPKFAEERKAAMEKAAAEKAAAEEAAKKAEAGA